jgi:preprotein translocase subunit SecA
VEVLDRVLTKVFGSKRDRDAKRLSPLAEQISALEPDMRLKSDSGLRELTQEFKKRLAEGESLEMLLAEAFAAVREAAKRTINMRHFDVQLMGGVALFRGNIAEMATGEGKTLVATLPAYLIALEEKGVHIVTVNDYLAKRDMEWMRPVYEFLGLQVGAIQHDQDPAEKQLAYQADITYGTNNEFGFDYLRSNLAVAPEDRPQRGLHYAIVDEVDSILIDEARTPLIISGPAEMSPETYYHVNTIIPRLRRETDFTVNEKDRNVLLTEEGMERAQQLLGLDNMFSEENLDIVHYLDQALRAHFLFQRDVHYVVQDDQVVIVDEFTGRLMPGRRWSDGLHQAVEAKEGVKIERENQTLATITFQNYFRMYERLAGMTGTADTEANEFREIYKLDVTVIPTNKPNIRIDLKDQVYGSEQEKFEAVVSQIVECHNRKQPVLVGTISIEKSEVLAELLKSRGHWKKKIQSCSKKILDQLDKCKFGDIDKGRAREALSEKEGISLKEAENWADKAEEVGDDRHEYLFTRLAEAIDIHETLMKGLSFNVLNAKYHGREADIVAQAGRPGAVTIATNMAGRGTDIILGGNPEKLIEEEVSRLGEEAPEEQQREIENRIRKECAEGRETVLEAGGLMIVGSERHESRRIDNQLRGRCARQGDPGLSRFFLSLQDDLMRLFGGERIQRIAERFGMEEGEVIEARLVDKSIRRAQKKVEDKNFEIRKYVIKYDDVMNKQREVIYKLRNELLEGEDPEEAFVGMQWDVFDTISQSHLDPKISADDWDLKSYGESLFHQFNLRVEPELPEAPNLEIATEDLERDIWERIKGYYEERKGLAPSEEDWKGLMRFIMLNTLDHKWKDHLLTMDHLKDSIGLRGYAGKDPQQEYSREGFELFQEMYSSLEREVVARMFRVEIRRNVEPVNRRMKRAIPGFSRGPQAATGPISTRRRSQPKVGRNDPCPCGSGKKYKKCCMKKEAVA